MAVYKELPEELIELILSKLPVKSLLRFKCVRKSWYSLIKSPCFVDLHLKSSRRNNDDCLIVRRCLQQRKRHVLSFYSPETLADSGIEIDTPFSLLTDAVSVSGPCNGLICITNNKKNNGKIFICNPSMREFRSLFVPPAYAYFQHHDTVAFGFDPNSCEYKVVMIGRFSCLYGIREAKVYDFITDSWRDTYGGIVVPNGFFYSPVAISLNGAFHWCPYPCEGDSILSFLISDEVTKEIPLPAFYSWQDECRSRDLYVLNNSLALIVYSSESSDDQLFEISVMTKYGVKESWTKLFVLGPFSNYHAPLAFWNSNGGVDQLLLESRYRRGDQEIQPQLVSCDLQHKLFTHFQIYGLQPRSLVPILRTPRGKASFDVFLYSESLVSVNSIG